MSKLHNFQIEDASTHVADLSLRSSDMPLVQLASEGDHGSALTNNGFRICTSSHTSCKDVTDFALVQLSISTSSLSHNSCNEVHGVCSSFLLALTSTNNNSKKKKQKNTLTKLKLALTESRHCWTPWSGILYFVAGGNSLVEEMHV